MSDRDELHERDQQYQSFSPPKYIATHWDSEPWRQGFEELKVQVAQQIAETNALKLQVKGLHKIINNMETKHE